MATVTPEKPRPEKPFFQVRGELTQAQLEAISKRSAPWQRAAGGITIN